MSSNYSRSPEDDFFYALDKSLTNEYSSQKMSNFINDLLAAINNLDDDPEDGFGFYDDESDYWSSLDYFTWNDYGVQCQRRLRKNRATLKSQTHDVSVDMLSDEKPPKLLSQIIVSSKREANNVSVDMFDDEAHDMSVDLFDDDEPVQTLPRAKVASDSETEAGDVSVDMFAEFENDMEVMDVDSDGSNEIKSNEHSEVVGCRRKETEGEDRITQLNWQRTSGSSKNESKTIIEDVQVAKRQDKRITNNTTSQKLLHQNVKLSEAACSRNIYHCHSQDILVCVPSNISYCTPNEDEQTVIAQLPSSPLQSRIIQQYSSNATNVPEILSANENVSPDGERRMLCPVDETANTSMSSTCQSSVFCGFSSAALLVPPPRFLSRTVQQSSSNAPKILSTNENLSQDGDRIANTSSRSSYKSSVLRGFSPVAPLIQQSSCASTKLDSDLNATLCEEYEFSTNFGHRRSLSRSPIFLGFSTAASPVRRTSEQRQNSICNLSRSDASTICDEYEAGRLLAIYLNATESINLDDAYTQCFTENPNQQTANISDRQQSLIDEIEKLVLKIQDDLVSGRKLSVAVPYKVSWENCVVVDERLFLKPLSNGGTRVISSKRKIALIVYILSFVYKLLINNETCTRRQIYYSDPEFTHSKIHVDDTIMDVCFLLNAPPWEIGILSSSKGLIAGSIKLTFNDDTILDVGSIDGGILLPHQTMTIKKVETEAKFVLLVEKHTIYEKLLLENVLNRLGPCILITGKGFPDINTRAILKKIWDDCKCPIYALVDADPFGIEIMLSYRHGSQKMSFFNESLAIPSIRWIGVLPSEIKKFNLQSLPLSQADVSRVDSLMNRPYLRKGIYKELLVMKKTLKKAEVEAVMSGGIVDWIESYLLYKIQSGGSI